LSEPKAGRLGRRDFLKTSGTAGLAALAGLISPQAADPAERPNILFLFTDDQRWSTLHALNNPEVLTPNMDKLIQRGVSFDHCCIMGGTIGAVCAPSRAMLMTGRSLFHVNNSDLVPKPPEMKGRARSDEKYTLFPDLLGKAGYKTFGTGKWHNGEHAYARAFKDGGNIFFGGMADHVQVPVSDFDPTGKYPQKSRLIGPKFSSELFTDSAVEFLGKQKGQVDPFFLYVAYTAPHDPRMAPKKYTAMYPPEKIKLPPNYMADHPFDNGELHVRDEELAPHPRTPEIVRENIAGYYAMITEVDEQIGRVLKALAESGKADNTIVVFAADNGLAVGQHGLLGKQNLYDHSVRVPLVIGGPGIPKGKTAHSLCYLMDIAPTLSALTGVPASADVEGTSLVPVLHDQEFKARDTVFLAYRHFQRGLRSDRWKLILYNVEGQQTTQLFDLQNDPWELHNLAGEKDQASRVQAMRKQIREWQRKTDDFVDIDKPNWGWQDGKESGDADDDRVF
jgi:arylsulfatase A-like enzyme